MTKSELAALIQGFGTYRLAKRLGIKHQSIVNWVRRGRVPAKRAIELEEIVGASRYALCPETFGPDPNSQASSHHPQPSPSMGQEAA